MIKILLLISLLFLLTACDQGVAPKRNTDPTGFSGKITFIGVWPDSIRRTHIVMFKNPLLRENDFSIFNIQYVSLEIPYGTQIHNYNSTDSSFLPETGYLDPGEYSYLAVAQSKTPELSLNRPDWFVTGLFVVPPDTLQPGKITIPEGTVIENIDIICDFDNPPPQPPGGR
jgi:hypothetical protein